MPELRRDSLHQDKFTSLVYPAYAQTDDRALAPSNLPVKLVGGELTLNWDAPAEDAGFDTGSTQ